MTSEEMKNEVLSRAAALGKARNRRIKTAAATAVCAVIICAAAVPIYRANRPGTVTPSAQTTVQNGVTAPAGNEDKTTARVTTSAPACAAETSVISTSAPKASASQTRTPPSDETQKSPNTVTPGETTTRRNEPTTKKNEPTTGKNESTTKKNDSETTAKPETTKKADTAKTEPGEDNDSFPDSKPPVPPVTEPATVRPAPTRPDSNSDSSADCGWLMENNKAGLGYESVDDIVNNKWTYYVKSVEYNSDLRMFKFSSVTPVFGWISTGEKSYTFYAESYAPIAPDGEYLGTVSDFQTSLPVLNSYKIYRFSGIKDEKRDMILVTDSERYFVFAETD